MNEENKRKAIILTFIGALTLLFVVVGGTYAYFQIVNTDEGETNTNFEAQTDTLNKYGTPLLTKKSDLYINLSASDMAYSKGGTSYWATEKKEPQEKNYEEERKNHVISTASIERPDSDDAIEDAYLSCTSELTITIDGEMKDVLETGDGTLYLGTSASGKNKGSITPESFDLADLVSKEATKENKVTVNYSIVGYTSVDVTADVEIINKKDKEQNVLAGTDIQITITNNNLSCSVSEKPKPVYAKVDNKSSGTLYRSSEYKNMIVSASFVDYVPNEEELVSKVKYWDLSDIESGTPAKSVIGWLESNIETPENYDLYIGSNSEIYVKDLSQTFYQMTNLEKVDLGNLNTSETTKMSNMFSGGYSTMKISEIKGLENFVTSKVTSMSYMFSGYQGTSLDLSSFDTSSVTTMAYMFSSCSNLTTLNLSSFDTSKVTKMGSMFAGLSIELPFKDWPNFVTTNVEEMGGMFDSYKGTTLDLSTFDTSKVTQMYSMFASCINLITLDLSNFNTSKVTNMNSMFDDQLNKTGIKATIIFPKGFGSVATNMSNMFRYYSGTTLDLSNFNTSKVTNMNSMFQNCNNLTTLDLSSFTFDKLTSSPSTAYTFQNVSSSCQVKIKSSQQEIFESKFPYNSSTSAYNYDRKFTPTYVD